VRPVLRVLLTLTLCVFAAAPAAHAATKKKAKAPTASTPAAPVVTAPPATPQGGAPGSAFGPIQPLATNTVPSTQTQLNTKRPDETGLGRGTLLLLVGLAFALIIGVGGLIWYEGRSGRKAARKRRQRLRAGRAGQPQAATAGRRGPPPPPRKRRAQAAARRKKR